ncbi:origin recognition complex subunit 2 [Encephalitozoon intestinalis ATCC 50506]|uniref:Origin recognition complex subunit 2 n=1 Tax=Encephalitozoon intestinalis (strain ATCC 50506) TaxID=876142 RepID=E0S9P8_ENCIT|nr:origin recognition complex subunit 2 [Encephalitozoon intestinalis ATCC 50506]ADM12433.1 origin recognition complex subunit 2 [Encephalitozoon intestinalis ATCC 50506]UTX46268.1 origin recognition complex subunit 2 [Encephalitozoon intestinalis]
MSSDLSDFHFNCKKELNALAKSFNILFYGYGSKMPLLRKMFPSAIHLNCRAMSRHEILLEIMDAVRRRSRSAAQSISKVSTIKDIDEAIGFRKEKYKIVMANFDFSMTDFSGLRNFAILGTIEEINIKFSFEDAEKFNFIFRDLTTFEPYEEEIAGIHFRETRAEASSKVVRNVPRNSRLVLKEILLYNSDVVGLGELFERIKRKLFLTSKTSVLSMISEFIDHGLLKVRNGSEITVCMSSAEKKEVAKELGSLD